MKGKGPNMERLDLDPEQVSALRALILNASASMVGTWEPEDDPKRTDVCPGSPIKIDDDVKVRTDGGSYRVIAPAPGRDRFTAWGMSPDFGMMMTTSFALADVTDRAPADPNETPMPVTVPLPDEDEDDTTEPEPA